MSNDYSLTAEAKILRIDTIANAVGSDELKVIYV
jgi:hypothetical protein